MAVTELGKKLARLVNQMEKTVVEVNKALQALKELSQQLKEKK